MHHDVLMMRASFWIMAAALLGSTSIACSSTTNGAGASGSSLDGGNASAPTCDPLAPISAPITLANVVGAGKSGDGTLYVIDEGRPEYRAFVSQGSVLQRKLVVGSGTTTDSLIASVEDASAPFSLKIESLGGTPSRMGIYRGTLAAKDFDIATEGESLTLVGTDALRAFTVANLPGKVDVEYDAHTDDGHRIFVTRPDVDFSYDQFRVFYGTDQRMQERALRNATRGSSTYLVFDLDGKDATALFPSSLSDAADKPSITVESTVLPLSLIADDGGAPGAGLTFVCL